MFSRILVIGATGLLGRPVVNRLTEGGHTVRILTRSAEKAHSMFGGTVEITEGSATNIDDVRMAMAGCGSTPGGVDARSHDHFLQEPPGEWWAFSRGGSLPCLLIAENVIVGSRRGVLLWSGSMGDTVTQNDISESSGPPGNGAAIRVIGNSQMNWITENTVANNEYGIDVGGADNNHILRNDVSHSAVDGFFVTSGLNTVEQNTAADSGRHGYYVSGRFNSFTGNLSSSNGGYGFLDETTGSTGDAGTDNIGNTHTPHDDDDRTEPGSVAPTVRRFPRATSLGSFTQ